MVVPEDRAQGNRSWLQVTANPESWGAYIPPDTPLTANPPDPVTTQRRVFHAERIPQESRLPWDHIWVLVRTERRLDTADLRWSGALRRSPGGPYMARWSLSCAGGLAASRPV